MVFRASSILSGFRDRSGTTAVELAIVCPLLVTLVFGSWLLGWALYAGGEVRHAVELGSRVFISNPDATVSDLQTAVASHLSAVPLDGITLTLTTQTVGSATNEHIAWSYQTTASIPFVPTWPLNFSGVVDVPVATP